MYIRTYIISTCICYKCSLFHTPGYVQGMSDLLAPLIVVMENEVDAFWCFVGYMDKVVRMLTYVHNKF